jgi:hypothetical protein
VIPGALLLACSDGDGSGPTTGAWSTLVEDAPGALLRVWGTDADEAYAVGADGDGDGSLVFRSDGQTATRLDPGSSGDLWWVHGVGPDDVRMVGEAGTIVSFRPSTGAFEALPSPGGATLFGAWGANADDVWYVGGRPFEPSGVVWRDRGDGARPAGGVPASTSSTAVFKVHGFETGEVWMVGQRGRTWYFDGIAWSEPDAPTTDTLFTVHGVRPDRVFAVGGTIDGVILAWDGAAWIDETPDGAPPLNGVWATDAERAFAVGFNGTVLERTGDGEWRDFEGGRGTFDDLHAVWVDPSGALWAVGGLLAADPPTGGTLVRYAK